MKVKELMRGRPRVSDPGDDLAKVGRIMAEIGAGVLPVVEDGDRVVGVITDRDVCLALAGRNRKPSEVTVREAMTSEVSTCDEEDDLLAALAVMRRRRVRRLPVVGGERRLAGLLSLDDVAVAAVEKGAGGHGLPSYDDIARTMQAINRHPLPEVAAPEAVA